MAVNGDVQWGLGSAVLVNSSGVSITVFWALGAPWILHETEGLSGDALRFEKDASEIVCLAAAGAPPGVVVLRAAGKNGEGSGRIVINSSGDGLRWRAPGSSIYGDDVAAGDDGEYLLFDGEDFHKFLRVQVYAARLEPDAWSEVELRDIYGNQVAGEDATAEEASTGDISEHNVTLRNASFSTIADLLAWLDPTTTGLEISDDGETWVSPTTEATALDLGTIAAHDSSPFYLRRTIAPGAESDAEILNHVHFRFDLT